MCTKKAHSDIVDNDIGVFTVLTRKRRKREVVKRVNERNKDIIKRVNVFPKYAVQSDTT